MIEANDSNKTVFPGAADTVGDGKDNNCDGVDGVDGDGDKAASIASGGKDCDDTKAGVHPGAVDRVGASCAKVSISVQTLTGGAVDAPYVALAMDAAGKPLVAYYNTFSSSPDLQHAVGGQWTGVGIDSSGSKTGQHISVAVDANGGTHAAYYDAGSSRLKVASRPGPTAKWSYATPDATKLTGQYTSIAVDAVGKLHVAYYDFGGYKLKYATDASGTWKAEVVDPAANVGEYASLAVAKDGTVHIAYYDAGKKALKHAWGKAGAWQVEAVDAVGDPGRYTSLRLGGDGERHIAYYAASTKDLRYASDASGKWLVETAFSQGSVGKYASLGLAPGPWGPVVAFLEAGAGQVLVGWRTSAGWVTEPIDSKVAGQSMSVAVGADGKVVVAYYNPKTGAVKLATAGCSQSSPGGVDENCDGVDGVDVDGDKIASVASGGLDCDDGDAKAYPCADELPGAKKDMNCDGKLAASCDDCQACTADKLSVGKCVHTAIAEGNSCDDGSACTIGETCKSGTCAGAAKVCTDANVCTADACVPASGCSFTPVGVGVGCDLDGSACTADVCAVGLCAAVTAVSCDDNNSCTKDACDAKTGKCAHTALGNGAGCDDGDACTLLDACQAGACKAGAAKTCPAGAKCVAGACKKALPPGMVLIPAGKFLMGCVPGEGGAWRVGRQEVSLGRPDTDMHGWATQHGGVATGRVRLRQGHNLGRRYRQRREWLWGV